MVEVKFREARRQLSYLFNRVEKGEEFIIKRRGKRTERMVLSHGENRLPSLRGFRVSLKVRGKPLSRTVIDGRKEERCRSST